MPIICRNYWINIFIKYKKLFSSHQRNKTRFSKTQCQSTVSCNKCGKIFRQKRNLARHIQTVHQNLKQFSCPQCDAEFGAKQTMERHIVACAKKKFKKQDFSCPECKLIFGAKQTLERHIGNVEL